jgi:hypothetical protein
MNKNRTFIIGAFLRESPCRIPLQDPVEPKPLLRVLKHNHVGDVICQPADDSTASELDLESQPLKGDRPELSGVRIAASESQISTSDVAGEKMTETTVTVCRRFRLTVG